MSSVLSSSVTIIFCEGRPGGLDKLLLSNIISGQNILIKPVGGKYGMRAFIEGYLDSSPKNVQPNYLGFRDRDFDVEPTETPQLTLLQGAKPIWLTYRSAIENYFINADLLHKYWSEHEKTPKWGYGSPPSIAEINEHIRQSAQDLIYYQAIRWALARLKPGARWPEIRTAWTKNGSGDIPISLDYDACLKQAYKLVLAFQEKTDGISIEFLQKYAATYREKFTDKNFLATEEYLVWFHGKDHLVQLCRKLAPNFPRRHYKKWAAENIDISNYPDLQQLTNLINEETL